jgi:hypothetical protein
MSKTLFFFNVGCHINGGILGQSLTQLVLSCKNNNSKINFCESYFGMKQPFNF